MAEAEKESNNTSKRSDALMKKDISFNNSLDELFDIARASALTLTKIEKNRQFLLVLREKSCRGKMVGVDNAALLKTETEAANRANSCSSA